MLAQRPTMCVCVCMCGLRTTRANSLPSRRARDAGSDADAGADLQQQRHQDQKKPPSPPTSQPSRWHERCRHRHPIQSTTHPAGPSRLHNTLHSFFFPGARTRDARRFVRVCVRTLFGAKDTHTENRKNTHLKSTMHMSTHTHRSQCGEKYK